MFIMISYIAFPNCRSFGRKILFYLSLADLGSSVAWLLTDPSVPGGIKCMVQVCKYFCITFCLTLQAGSNVAIFCLGVQHLDSLLCIVPVPPAMDGISTLALGLRLPPPLSPSLTHSHPRTLNFVNFFFLN